MDVFEATTAGFQVTVQPTWLPDQSDPARGLWRWAYEVIIRNQSDSTAQLVDRHWLITDARGRVEEVRGAGVVGELPVIAPGMSFAYVSGCALASSSGSMEGSYGMVWATSARPFRILIPRFALHTGEALGTLH
jgi:ApaG protein